MVYILCKFIFIYGYNISWINQDRWFCLQNGKYKIIYFFQIDDMGFVCKMEKYKIIYFFSDR